VHAVLVAVITIANRRRGMRRGRGLLARDGQIDVPARTGSGAL
jgi:hypothetical protein